MQMNQDIAAVVTGGASGLGRATAEALAAQGVKVAKFDINVPLGEEVAASIGFTCTFTNTKLPILRLQKALPSGRFNAGDQFTLNIVGTGGPASVTTTGAGTTATGTATLNPGAVGAS